MPTTTSTVSLPSGLVLELTHEQPSTQTNAENSRLAVLLHPWSYLGGRMTDPVLRSFVHPLRQQGFHVILYNSRGVGRSSGWASLTGTRESEDLQEVVQWGLASVPNVQHVLLIGYSYGALIVSRHPLLSAIRTSHILLSYPLGPRSFLTCFRSHPYDQALHTLVRDPRADVLIVFGNSDEFTGVSSYEHWTSQLREDGGADGIEGGVKIACIDGATHFWGQEGLKAMLNVVKRWLERRQY